jgi:hypothetical protein
MNYEAKFVLIGFYAQNQKAGTKEDRERWDQDVFDKFDRHILDACQQAGFEPTDEARSIMAVLSNMSPGTAAKTRAGRAVAAYLEYRGL